MLLVKIKTLVLLLNLPFMLLKVWCLLVKAVEITCLESKCMFAGHRILDTWMILNASNRFCPENITRKGHHQRSEFRGPSEVRGRADNQADTAGAAGAAGAHAAAGGVAAGSCLDRGYLGGGELCYTINHIQTNMIHFMWYVFKCSAHYVAYNTCCICNILYTIHSRVYIHMHVYLFSIIYIYIYVYKHTLAYLYLYIHKVFIYICIQGKFL